MKRGLSGLLCFVLMQAVLCADAVAIQSTNPSARQHTASLSRLVEKVGSGRNVLVAVRLQDGSVAAGYMASPGPFSFSISDAKTDAVRTVYYAEVNRMVAYNLVTGVEVEQGGGLCAKLVRALGYVVPLKRVSPN